MAFADYVQIAYSAAEPQIRDADLLLFHAKSFESAAIQMSGRSQFNHAAKAVWARKVLWCVDTMEHRGGAAIPLKIVLERYPGYISLCETNPDNMVPYFDREKSADWIWQNIPGRPYGTIPIKHIIWTKVPCARWFLKPSFDDKLNSNDNQICSSACSVADRIGGGFDPVPNLADIWTEPGDLARSAFYRYKFTLAKDNA